MAIKIQPERATRNDAAHSVAVRTAITDSNGIFTNLFKMVIPVTASSIDHLMQDDLFRAGPDAVHTANPLHLILFFQFFCNTLLLTKLPDDVIQPLLGLFVQVGQVRP
jgi:hypothetical protein